MVLEQPIVTIKEFVQNYPPEEFKGVLGIPLLLSEKGGKVDNLNGWRTWKEFMSGPIKINGGEVGYRFWTSAVTNVADFYDVAQGVGRFIYVPSYGIIGGSYDFYFHTPILGYRKTNKRIYTHKLSKEQWDSNILEEKVMIADGFTIDQ